jgi:hypothetical protein
VVIGDLYNPLATFLALDMSDHHEGSQVDKRRNVGLRLQMRYRGSPSVLALLCVASADPDRRLQIKKTEELIRSD